MPLSSTIAAPAWPRLSEPAREGTYVAAERESAASAGPSTRVDSGAALQHPYRRGVRAMDPAVHSVSRQAPPAGDGRAGVDCVSERSRRTAQGRRLDAKSSVARNSLSLSRRPEGRPAVVG